MHGAKSMTESMKSVAKVDRLTAFFEAFQLRASMPPEAGEANFFVLVDADGCAEAVTLHMRSDTPPPISAKIAAHVDFEGADNPLMTALPDAVEVRVSETPTLRDAVSALVGEAHENRCGRQAAVNRLCEVIVLLMLRTAIDRGTTRPGLLAGLSHPTLHRALAAIHGRPDHPWSNEELSETSAMSRSHFMAQFRKIVGATPQAYLITWRLSLARRKLANGGTVKAVARQVGFGSAAAFSRAYFRKFEVWPSQVAGKGE